MKKKHLTSGWADDSYTHTPYHFTHYPRSAGAAELKRAGQCIWAIETINGTHGAGDKKSVHKNTYFELDLGRAIGLAALIELAANRVNERVVNLRPATAAEQKQWVRIIALQEALPKMDLASIVGKR